MKLINTENYAQIIQNNQHYLDDIYNICCNSNENVEGNCFYEHLNINNKVESLITKQMNHFSLGMIHNNIMEIGFNAGHSVLLYLLSNPNSIITIFDLCDHNYTMNCFKYLDQKFPNRLRMIVGDSTVTIPLFYQQYFYPKNSFDLIHIDGCHNKKVANKDFFHCYKMASGTIIFDDTNIPELNELFNSYVELDIIEELYLYKTSFYEHRIGKIVK